jgi:DNA-binding transcriptional LysR family regulator
MDRLDAMRLFARVVDRRSFTKGAQDLGIPRSTATQVIKQLEDRLGVRLLQRTTRTVRPTLDGEAYYQRCLTILDDVEDAEGAFRGAEPKGQLRIEVQGSLARHFLMPAIPQFLADHPQITISMSEGERWIDVVQEGVDCVLRYGALPDSDLAARRVTMLNYITVGAPQYLEKFGRPETLSDLANHRAVGLRSITTGALRPFRFVDGAGERSIDVDGPLSVTGTESFRDAVLLGLGLAQMPIFRIARDLEEGTLVQVLAEYPVPSAPVSVLYARNRHLSPRVRKFIDWTVQQFANAADQSEAHALIS